MDKATTIDLPVKAACGQKFPCYLQLRKWQAHRLNEVLPQLRYFRQVPSHQSKPGWMTLQPLEKDQVMLCSDNTWGFLAIRCTSCKCQNRSTGSGSKICTTINDCGSCKWCRFRDASYCWGHTNNLLKKLSTGSMCQQSDKYCPTKQRLDATTAPPKPLPLGILNFVHLNLRLK